MKTKSYLEDPFNTNILPEINLPTTLDEVNKLIALQKFNNSNLSEKEKLKLLAFENAVKTKNRFTKTLEEKKKEKKLKKIASKSRARNR